MTERGWVDRIAVPAAAVVSVMGFILVAALLGPRTDTVEDWTGLTAAASATVPAALGWRIVHLDPGNVVGRRLTWLGLALSWLWVIGGLVFYGAVELRDTDALWVRWVALADQTAFLVAFLAMTAVVLVFPNGRHLSPRWERWEKWVIRAVFAVVVLALFDGTELIIDGHPEVPRIISPLPSSPVVAAIAWPFILLLFGWLIATAVAVRRRFRRSAGIERLQLSWLAYAAALIPLSVLACFIEGFATGGPGVAVVAALALTTIAIPAAITVAMLRYRLYEIERLVNRTLVYATLTVILAAAYGAIALLVGIALGGGAVWGTAVATLAVATAFRPVRDRLQRSVDRRFAKRRYDGLRLVETFIEDVRAGREEPERVGKILEQAMGDKGLEVFFRLPASGGFADATGRLTDLPSDEVRGRTPVMRGDLELGVIVHEPALRLRLDTFDSIVRAAALPIEIARLRVEVRVQLAEVEASRARIVAAADAERRKLERDLHDGAQQRLVALGLALRHTQSLLGTDEAQASRTLDDAVGEVTVAVAELREIARGLRPGVLESGGLAGALSDVAGRLPIPVALEITREGIPAELEAEAFFLSCEAITNAVKHSGARHIRVRVDRRGEVLSLEVADDGVGGAAPTAGGGLSGMAQRAAARGGQLAVDSPAGGGTTIRAELPVGAG